MKRPVSLRLEPLEDRTTPSTLSVSIVPDGTAVGAQQSNLFQEVGGASSGPWQQELLGLLGSAASQSGASLSLVPNGGNITVSAVDQVFASDGTVITAPAGQEFLVISGPVNFGGGLGLVGPNGQPLSPTPGGQTGTGLPLILPVTPAYGNLYGPTDSAPSAPAPSPPSYSPPPTSSPQASSGSSSSDYSGASSSSYSSGSSSSGYSSGGSSSSYTVSSDYSSSSDSLSSAYSTSS